MAFKNVSIYEIRSSCLFVVGLVADSFKPALFPVGLFVLIVIFPWVWSSAQQEEVQLGGKWSRFRFCLCLAALHMSFLSPVLTHQQIEKKKIEKPWSSDRKQHKYLFLSFWSVPLHNTTICLFSLIFFILE